MSNAKGYQCVVDPMCYKGSVSEDRVTSVFNLSSSFFLFNHRVTVGRAERRSFHLVSNPIDEH